MHYRKALGLVLLLLASACSQYDFSVNDRVVYTPKPLFADWSAVDPGLQACIQAAIEREKITSAAQLAALSCRGDGIENLAGIEVFTGLRQLQLDGNRVALLAPLGTLSSLEELYLADNRIVDPVPLYDLLSLRILDLSGNEGLKCPRRQDLLRVVDLVLPGHCPD